MGTIGAVLTSPAGIVAAAAAAAVLAIVASPRLPLAVCATCRHVLARVERASLRKLAAASKKTHGGSPKENPPWFAGLQQQLTSAATNTVDTDPKDYTGPTVYQAEHDLPLPYPPIADDTEAISGFVDLVKLKLARPGELVLNLGGGAFDGGPKWLEQQVPGVRVLSADPFRRSAEHNAKVQGFVEGEGGAHVVASISVLNVIAEVGNRVEHIALAHATLRPGGTAYFKVWGGCWPERGNGVGEADEARGTYQTLRWADAYLAEVKAVFGEGQCYADPVASLLVAVKAA